MPGWLRSAATAAAAAAAAAGAPLKVPSEYFYTKERGKVTEEQGCTVRRWGGMDPYGASGYPSVATVDCPAGHTYTANGWCGDGPLQYYVWDGEVEVNGQPLSLSGSSFWVNVGSRHALRIRGRAYVVGGAFTIVPGPGALFPNAYDALQWRGYDLADGVAGRNNATMVHDIHINNGTDDNNCKDVAWAATPLQVDPAAVTVFNCATGRCGGDGCSRPGNETYVWNHYHPNGALYIPYSGTICFWNPDEKCATPGFPRWTSPILRYYETFRAPEGEPPAGVKAAVDAAGPWSPACDRPVLFSVTHFDIHGGAGGVPNFVDDPGQAAGRDRPVAHRATQRLTSLVQYDRSGR